MIHVTTCTSYGVAARAHLQTSCCHTILYIMSGLRYILLPYCRESDYHVTTSSVAGSAEWGSS